MAQLDPLLKALRDRRAIELVLREGQKPTLRSEKGLKAVSPRALTRVQIVALLTELAGPMDAVKLKGGEAVTFTCALEGSGSFTCSVETAGNFCASVQPCAAGANEPVAVPVATAVPVVAVQAETTPPAGMTVDPATIPDRQAPAPQPRPVATPSRSAIDATGSTSMDQYLGRMFEMDASDLHLSADETPMVRLHGEMVRLEGQPKLSASDTQRLIDSIMPERNRKEFSECNDTDFAHEIPGMARFRCNVFMDRKGVGGVFRTIPTDILTAEQLGLPPTILNMCNLSKGLVLVTGPTGSGKSTTLAAMVDYINKSRTDHIITIEDPIEFVHPNQKCLVNQREIVTHTTGFKKALRAALREDPDIVLVGEMRDLETIAIAIETAETGHLVFGTLHTTTAISTVDRIIDQFPADRQAQIRTMLSESLRGVIAQTLLKKIGGGRVAALEVLVVNSAISNLIREGKTFQIASLMQTGKRLGMQLLNDVLIDLVKKKTVDVDEAYHKAVDKASFLSSCKTNNLKVNLPTKKDD